MEAINASVHAASPGTKASSSDKAPFKLQAIWAVRVRLQMANRMRELALSDRAIDSTGLATWSNYGYVASATVIESPPERL